MNVSDNVSVSNLLFAKALLGSECVTNIPDNIPDPSKLLAQYQNGGYQVQIFENGTKIRTQTDSKINPLLPEQMDLKLTDWCDAGCAWCHERSTRLGKHADIKAALELLKPLPPGVEIAIGGGDPLSHPQFEQFVNEISAQGLIASVTVNGRHLERHMDVLTRLTEQKKLWGVGVSLFDQIPQWDYVNLVLHMIAGIDNTRILDGVARKKILILGYKRFGRGLALYNHQSQQVDQKINQWYRELPLLARDHHLSFDNLAIAQLKPERLFKNSNSYDKKYMGQEGEFSLYIDAVTQTYAVSSYSSKRQPWKTIQQCFQDVRENQF